MNGNTFAATRLILKGVIASTGDIYAKGFEKGYTLYNSKTAQAIRSFLAAIYYLLATKIDELEARANARWIEKYHKTILCTCRTCDPQYLWKTKGMRELRKSWM